VCSIAGVLADRLLAQVLGESGGESRAAASNCSVVAMPETLDMEGGRQRVLARVESADTAL
jgi:hypothetical protein